MTSGQQCQQLRVRVTARAHTDRIEGMRDGVLRVRVSAAPVDGRANAAVCRLLAKRLGIAAGRVTIVRGETHREKTLRIEGVSARNLGELLSGATNEEDEG
jgi:uncharacterized protein (TIGR00251 family)